MTETKNNVYSNTNTLEWFTNHSQCSPTPQDTYSPTNTKTDNNRLMLIISTRPTINHSIAW